jgi:hypothetical protein
MLDSARVHAWVVAKNRKGRDAPGRPKGRSSLLEDPGANFLYGNKARSKKRENDRFAVNPGGSWLSRCLHRTAQESSDDRPPHALKIPARQGGIYALAIASGERLFSISG